MSQEVVLYASDQLQRIAGADRSVSWSAWSSTAQPSADLVARQAEQIVLEIHLLSLRGSTGGEDTVRGRGSRVQGSTVL
jgi:hypothetical protein